jgi:hypothetical protein
VLVEGDYLEGLKGNAVQVIPLHGPDEWAALSNRLRAKAISKLLQWLSMYATASLSRDLTIQSWASATLDGLS